MRFFESAPDMSQVPAMDSCITAALRIIQSAA